MNLILLSSVTDPLTYRRMLSRANLSVESPTSGDVWSKLVRSPAPTVTEPIFNWAIAGVAAARNPARNNEPERVKIDRFCRCFVVTIPRFCGDEKGAHAVGLLIGTRLDAVRSLLGYRA